MDAVRSLEILFVGGDAEGASGTTRLRLAEFGHEVVDADRTWPIAQQSGDAIALDLDDAVLTQDVLRGVFEDSRPLLLVAEAPSRAAGTLLRRPAGVVLVTGQESDAGYRVALSLCAACTDGLVAVAA